jgi:hypothetical protein
MPVRRPRYHVITLSLPERQAKVGGGGGVAGLGSGAVPAGGLVEIAALFQEQLQVVRRQALAPHHQQTEIECGLSVAGFCCGAPHGLHLVEPAELYELNARLVRIGLIDRGGVKRRDLGCSFRFGLIDPLNSV